MTPRFAAWLSGLLLLALASGMTSAEAGDKIKIGAVRVASPLFVAQERGYFQAQVKPLQSNTTVMAALAGNTIDAAVMPATVSVAGLARNEAKLLGWVSDIGEPFLPQ